MKFFAPFRISENISETPEGYLLCRNVAIGHTGDLEYMNGEIPLTPGPDGKIIVSRDAKDVFSPETIASFEGKPITIRHPNEFVSPANWNTITKGVVQNVRRGTGEQENDLVADFLITSQEAIDLVKGGLREVSCGYEAEYTQTGVGRGLQSCIIGNHVALVEQGRAGAAYAINDHKGKGIGMTFLEKFKSIFGEDASKELVAAAKDAAPVGAQGAFTMADMKSCMDAGFAKMKDELAEGFKKDVKAKDAEKEKGEKKEDAAKDAEGSEQSMEDRLKKLEDLVAKLVSSKDSDEEESEESEESEDDYSDKEEANTGDSAEQLDLASRVEILAPGMSPEGKNVKAKAILAAYGTTDGKAAIHKYTGGKAPNTKDEAICDMLFVGASEALKELRGDKLADIKAHARDSLNGTQNKGAKTPEEINKINEEHFAKKS